MHTYTLDTDRPHYFLGLLDDLDKELNNYVMRCREWYGWHFPELGKLVSDNLVYAKTVKTIGVKENCADMDLSSVLPEELEAEVKEMAEVSMGTEVPLYPYQICLFHCHGNRFHKKTSAILFICVTRLFLDHVILCVCIM